MKLTVTLGDLLGHRVWNVIAEAIEVPIGVSGGGFGPLRIPVRLYPQLFTKAQDRKDVAALQLMWCTALDMTA